ncbi:MAG: ABC transporter ATP-binding protein [Candidatus Paceibacterota bacterium]|jgi:ATP-binding cassette subfamily B protein
MQKHKTLKNFWDLLRNSWRIIKIVCRYMPWHTAGMVFLTVIIGAVPVFAFKAMGSLIDSIIAGATSGVLSAVWIALAVYALLSVLPSVASVFRRYLDRVYFLRLQDYFDLMVLKKRASFDISQYEDTKFLDFMQRAFNQSHFPLINLTDGIIENIQMISGIIIGSAAALMIDWKIFILVILFSIPEFIVEVKYGGQIWHIFQKNSTEQRRNQDLRRFFSAGSKYAVIDGKLFQVGKKFLEDIKKILSDFTNEQLKAEFGRTFLSFCSTVLAAIGLFIATALIIKSAVAGIIAIGTVVYAFQTLSRISGETSKLLSSVAKLLERNLYVTDIFTVLDTLPVLPRNKNSKKLSLLEGKMPDIKFENVSFKYKGSDVFALKNVSFEINGGEKLGLVGNNGSGKSTIVKLLLRIYDPTEGRITANGIDLKDLDQDEWWSYTGVLLQDYITYNFSVKESIAVGKIDEPVNMPIVEKSANQSTISSFVNELDHKYDHMIGVEFGGVEPSKGQRQKLAIARALYRQPKLLILDEPTASIDSESAVLIFNEIENIPETTSAILISHNFATIKRATKIIVLDNGNIIEEGTHDDLIIKDGRYSKSYGAQKKEFD